MWSIAVAVVVLGGFAVLASREGSPKSSGATWTLLFRVATKPWSVDTFDVLKTERRPGVVYVRKLGPGVTERASMLVYVDRVLPGGAAIVRVAYDDAGFRRLSWMPPAGHLLQISLSELVSVR